MLDLLQLDKLRQALPIFVTRRVIKTVVIAPSNFHQGTSETDAPFEA